MKKEYNSEVVVFLGGALVGLFLAGEGFLSFQEKVEPPTLIKVVTVTKIKTEVVDKVVTKVVDRVVDHTTVVTEKKLYKASKLDENGNVVQQWTVTKCKFRVIGAQLTDENGDTFDVRGNIRVDAIEK